MFVEPYFSSLGGILWSRRGMPPLSVIRERLGEKTKGESPKLAGFHLPEKICPAVTDSLCNQQGIEFFGVLPKGDH